MPWTQADLDALDAAIASRGVVKSVQFADRATSFDSVEDMRKLRAEMQRALSTADGTSKAHRLAATSKGV